MRKNKLLYIHILLLLLLVTHSTHAQEALNYSIEANSAFSSGKHAPFWFTANRNAISSIENNNGYVRYSLEYDNRKAGRSDISYTIAADIVAGYNRSEPFVVQQAYASLEWKWLSLTIGSKERGSEQEHFNNGKEVERASGNNIAWHHPSMLRSQLGSGGLAFSGNSRPIPQARLEIPCFTSIPGTKEWLQIRGHISYGLFTDAGFQEEFTRNNPNAQYGRNILYHSKALFIKVGNPKKFPLTVEGGLEMHTQFGGDIYTHAGGLKYSMPRKPMDFFKAFIPLSGSDDTPEVEQTNISGNQIGSWHAAFTFHTPKADIRIYGEHMFEDFSQLFFFEYQQNKEGKKKIIYYPWRDIQIGINILNKSKAIPFISNIRYEYLTTRDQSGALYHDPSEFFNEQMDGCDNYYNHGIYPGWHHWGMGIGNPLLISPAYNSNGSLQFRSNRLIAHNFGVNGIFKYSLPVAYRLNYTYSENWGTYANPYDSKKYTTSLLAEITLLPRESNWAGRISLGYDKSTHTGNSSGIMFTIIHCGTIFKRQ